MKTIFSIFLLLFIIQFNLIGQLSFGKDFDRKIFLAEAAFDAQEYKKSALLYDEALEMKNGIFPLSGYFQDGLKAWCKAKNKDRAFFYLKKALSKGWIPKKVLKESEYFNFLRNDDRWNFIVKEMEIRDRKYGNIVDKLKEVQARDQTLRVLMKCAKEDLKQDSSYLNYFRLLMKTEDQKNLNYVESIISQYGWLGMSKIGEKANSTLWLIIQHADLEVQLKYLPYIKSSVLKGESNAKDYAFLVDRISVNEGKEQIYGTQVVFEKKENIYKIYKINDVKNVNVRRAEIGFEPLADYLSFFDIKGLTLDNISNYYLKD